MLHKVQSVAVWITFPVECSLVIKTDCIGNEGIAFPSADGVSHPKRTSIFVMRTPIRVDSAHEVIKLEEHDHLARNLNDLHRKVEKVDSWHAWGKTIENVGSLKSVLGLELRYTELAALNFASAQGVIGEIAFPKSRLMGECDGSRSRVQSPDKSGVEVAGSAFAIPCWSAV